jgi:ParB family chromosome partitioning protein
MEYLDSNIYGSTNCPPARRRLAGTEKKQAFNVHRHHHDPRKKAVMKAARLKVAQIHRNPEQPRTLFDVTALQELADSIKQNGLLQPITVRRVAPVREASGRFPSAGEARFMIVAGERRWRAHQIAGLDEIDCNVVDVNDDQLAIGAIVENLQRADITPLEEGRAFARMIVRGYTPETLAHRLGIKQPHRITERLHLLKLRPEYQDLMTKRQLTPSQGTELARLDAETQPLLFAMITKGQCPTYARLRAAADGFVSAASQPSMFEMAPAHTAEEVATLSKFERLIGRLTTACNDGISDCEVVVLRKVDPGRAAIVIEQLALIRQDLGRMEKVLQAAVAQGQVLAA